MDFEVPVGLVDRDIVPEWHDERTVVSLFLDVGVLMVPVARVVCRAERVSDTGVELGHVLDFIVREGKVRHYIAVEPIGQEGVHVYGRGGVPKIKRSG